MGGRIKNSTRSGYTQHRHGETFQRGLPYLAKRVPEILGADQFSELVVKTVEIVRDWHFNRWEHEGAIRATYRTEFIRRGHGWVASDQQAEKVLHKAYVSLGRGPESRPTWWQGQHEAIIGRDNCIRCRRDLTAEQRQSGERYCGDPCRLADKEYRAEIAAYADRLMRATAQDAVARAKRGTRLCVICNEPFSPGKDETQTCSPRCTGELRRIHQPRQCANPACSNEFTPSNATSRPSLYCSPECYRAGIASTLPMRRCAEATCQDWFQPKVPKAKFCCHTCAAKDSQRKKASARGPLHPERPCDHCGKLFRPFNKRGRFCCLEHKVGFFNAARKATKG
ncbi:hypothetical protein [Devosia sp. Root436]|uniref:hypothetical protein n=1 Tax=Devosia sp. Root436 TaxID=1736537 RepID=UPI000B00F873|nr:hypothetical protein [Devosia sp. Root436]